MLFLAWLPRAGRKYCVYVFDVKGEDGTEERRSDYKCHWWWRLNLMGHHMEQMRLSLRWQDLPMWLQEESIWRQQSTGSWISAKKQTGSFIQVFLFPIYLVILKQASSESNSKELPLPKGQNTKSVREGLKTLEMCLEALLSESIRPGYAQVS